LYRTLESLPKHFPNVGQSVFQRETHQNICVESQIILRLYQLYEARHVPASLRRDTKRNNLYKFQFQEYSLVELILKVYSKRDPANGRSTFLAQSFFAKFRDLIFEAIRVPVANVFLRKRLFFREENPLS